MSQLNQLTNLPHITMASTLTPNCPVGTTAYDPKTGNMMTMTSNGPVALTGTVTAGTNVSTSNLTITPSNRYQPMLTTDRDEVYLCSGEKKVSVSELVDLVDTLRQRLCILVPAIEKHEHYPALKEAYENYKLIEKLVSGDHGEMP